MMRREVETYGDAEGLVEGTLGPYERIEDFEEGRILGTAPSNSPLMHLAHRDDKEGEGEEDVLTSLALLADPCLELSCCVSLNRAGNNNN